MDVNARTIPNVTDGYSLSISGESSTKKLGDDDTLDTVNNMKKN